MTSDTTGSPDAEVVDLLAVVRERGWPEARITALRNTCAAAAAKETMPSNERALAAAVAAALSGHSRGISAEHMRILARAELV